MAPCSVISEVATPGKGMDAVLPERGCDDDSTRVDGRKNEVRSVCSFVQQRFPWSPHGANFGSSVLRPFHRPLRSTFLFRPALLYWRPTTLSRHHGTLVTPKIFPYFRRKQCDRGPRQIDFSTGGFRGRCSGCGQTPADHLQLKWIARAR